MNWQFPKLRSNVAPVGWRLLPGGIAALVVIGLLRLGAWQPLEQMAYNALFLARGSLPWDERVVVVAIDEISIRKLGRIPLSRQYYARLLDLLTQADASVVVLNVVFSEPSQDDATLAEAIAQQGRVVLAQAWDSNGQPLPPTLVLRENAIGIGHVLNRPDTDGITRQIESEIQGFPNLGIAAVQSYSLVQEPIPLPDPNHIFWINWLSSTGQVPEYSLVEVLNDQIPAQTFHNKIVVVGVTATGIDNLFTPFNRNPPATGVHLNATVINNLLQQNFLNVPGMGWLMFILVLGGPGLSCILFYWDWGQRLIALSGLCLSWGMLSLLCFRAGYWLPVASPIILFAATTAIVEVGERLRINARLQQDIERLWQVHYQDLLLWTMSPSAHLPAQTVTSSGNLSSSTRSLQPMVSQPIIRLTELADWFARAQSAHAAIARSLSIGLLAADWDGLVWFCNPVAAEWLRIRVGDTLQIRLVPDWFTQTEWQTHWQQLHTKQIVRQEMRRGNTWFEVKLEPLFYQPALITNGQKTNADPTGVLLLVEDITPRKQAEAEIRKALDQERELNELKSRFVTTISHEFRTPLTTIQSAAELLEYYEWSTQQKEERFHQIRIAVQYMIQLLEDVLVIGKVEAGKTQLKPQLINLREFCQMLVAEQQLTAGNQYHFNFVSWGEPQLVWLDSKLLRQVLNNLLSNAVKYSPQGGNIELTLKYQTNHAVLQVHDEGIGIPVEDQKRLFEAFYRAANVGMIQGTGLGLAIVKKCVELCGGQVEVESTVGGGTTFIITLPIHYP